MKNFLIVTFIFVLGTSCSKQEVHNAETSLLKHTVLTYNESLEEGYKNLNMSSLVQVASKRKIAKAYYHMVALGEGRTRMIAKLQQIHFTKIVLLDKKKATVKTTEHWKYSYQNIDTGKTILQDIVDYQLTYFIEKDGDHWLVDNIVVDDSSSHNNRKLPFMTRPPEDKRNMNLHKNTL